MLTDKLKIYTQNTNCEVNDSKVLFDMKIGVILSKI